PIEQALASLGNPTPTTHRPPPTTTHPPPTGHQSSATGHQSPAASPRTGRLHAALLEAGMQFTADAIAHSQITESNGELHFPTPDEFKLAMNEKDILKVVQKVAGRAIRVKTTLGANATEAPPAGPPQPPDDVSERALSHPEVRRFQEMFPDAQV